MAASAAALVVPGANGWWLVFLPPLLPGHAVSAAGFDAGSSVPAAQHRRRQLNLPATATDAECEAAEVRAQRGRGASVLRLGRTRSAGHVAVAAVAGDLWSWFCCCFIW